MIYISEFLLYCCFGIVAGNQLLSLIPENKRPEIRVPNWLVTVCIIGIAFLSFFPLLDIAMTFAEGFDGGFMVIFQSVLFEFNVGHAWLITLFLSAILLFIRAILRMTNEPKLEYFSAAFTFALVLAFGWASHCTASYQLKGFIPHAIHFLSVSVWIGTLFVISWFSKSRDNWFAFLNWFSPLALTCLVATLSAGFFLMNMLVPDYVNSWIVSYGQALLLKHLLIIPLLVFAFINGVMVRKALKKNPNFNPIPWARAESIMALFVFGAMAVMGQQSPTENLAAVIQFDNASPLFQAFYDNDIDPTTTIRLVSNVNSILLGIISVLLLASMVLLFRKKARSIFPIGLGILFVCSAFTAIMLSVQ